MENLNNRIAEICSYPLQHRISELICIIEQCSMKELQDIFPALVNSIFGGLGWGLRTITREFNPYEFELLYNFFNPAGHMFSLCYNLLSDALKFDVPIAKLPTNLRHMLETGRYPIYYSDLINVDPFSRQISHISLNAFDYYMLHFALHGMVTLHKVSNAALRIHTDKWNTVYFTLNADYMVVFLPSSPESIVFPQNISGVVKPAPPIQPNNVKCPAYIRLSALTRHVPTTTPTTRMVDRSGRNNAWRTESVLYLFMDTWLRYNFDESLDLPSSEFIRSVRVLIKQVHNFGNAAELDTSAMAELRKQAQPMMCALMFSFLKGLMSRWPLDCSFQAVLELWLSYIQPWRYTPGRNYNTPTEIVVGKKFEPYIQDNLADYTQIFIQLLPRYERLDLSSIKNVIMLYRLVKVFGQPGLVMLLRQFEGVAEIQQPYKLSPTKSIGRHGIAPGYTKLFDEPMRGNIWRVLHNVRIAEAAAKVEKKLAERVVKEQYEGIWNNIKSFFSESEDKAKYNNLMDKQRLPEVLKEIGDRISDMFNVAVSEDDVQMSLVHEQKSEDQLNASCFSEMYSFDGSFPSPTMMRSRVPTYKGDPALLPIGSHEVTFLVRFFHQFCCKFNAMFANELCDIWSRQDVRGKLLRPLLVPPMTAEYLDKSVTGYSVLRHERLGPRINLRPLASYWTLVLMGASFCVGYILFRVPSFGFFLFLLVALIKRYLTVALASDKE